MNPVVLAAPLFFLFELWQLYISERYLGLKQIRLNADPRDLPMKTAVAAGWSTGLMLYGAWMLLLLLQAFGRTQGIVLLAVTIAGYSLRAASGLKWTLVILTFESSIRIGMLVSLMAITWRRL
jgi:hypothetical protein